MKVAAIIAEYNPFHKGHLYHIEQTKKITDCDYLIIVMSGDYTQRGEPAIFDKYFRTHQALMNGADLVLELPSLFSTASAEGFAFGAISLLHKLGVCNFLSFGSETGEAHPLKEAALFLNKEPDSYQRILKTYLKEGNNYPTARTMALQAFFPKIDSNCFHGSNNILALEYYRALDYFHSPIKAIPIKRIHNNYNDSSLAKEGLFSSATAIRNAISTTDLLHNSQEFLFSTLKNTLPESFFTVQKEEYLSLHPVFPKDFSLLLPYKVLTETSESILGYLDINRELASRIYNKVNTYTDWDSFCQLLKSKEITHTRIRRCLLHLLLNLGKEEMEYYKANNYCPYAKVLGFRKSSTALLHKIKENSSIPLITKNAKASSLLSERDFSLFAKECSNSHIYQTVVSHKYHLALQNEYTKTPVMI